MSLSVKFEDYTWPMKNPSHVPYQHQKETTSFILKNKRCYVLNDLGTGKTLSALWACDFLLANQKIKKILISSPLSTLQVVWGNEIFFNFPHLRYVVAHGNKLDRITAIRSKVQFVIINHDALVTMQSQLLAEKFDVFIIDEMTAFKNHKTDRSKAAIAIALDCKAVWGMTAEPTPNGAIEAYGQAKLVNPDNPFLPKLYSKFKNMVEEEVSMFVKIPKEGSEKTVFRILQPAIRFERDKCIDIPACQYIDRIVAMTDGQKSAYKDMHKKLLVEFENGLITAANAAVKVMKLTQIASGWVKDDLGVPIELDSKIRLDALWEIFVNTHKSKLVVFSAFRASIVGVTKFFKQKKVNAEYINGGVPQKQRAKLIDDFQNGDLNVIVIQPQSTAHGITLTAADTIVWHSLVPSGEIYSQANGRITRIGQTRKQSIIHLIGCNAEKRIRSILKNKGIMSKEIRDLFADN